MDKSNNEKTLIVAHPDDEILWFNPEEFDKIIIVFSNGYKEQERKNALAEHPLNVICWNLTESNYWRDKSKIEEYNKNYNEVLERVAKLKTGSITTHNAYGEYGHTDHILVHNAVMEGANCPVNGKDPKLFKKIKQVYERHGAWTWY